MKLSFFFNIAACGGQTLEGLEGGDQKLKKKLCICSPNQKPFQPGNITFPIKTNKFSAAILKRLLKRLTLSFCVSVLMNRV